MRSETCGGAFSELPFVVKKDCLVLESIDNCDFRYKLVMLKLCSLFIVRILIQHHSEDFDSAKRIIWFH